MSDARWLVIFTLILAVIFIFILLIKLIAEVRLSNIPPAFVFITTFSLGLLIKRVAEFLLIHRWGSSLVMSCLVAFFAEGNSIRTLVFSSSSRWNNMMQIEYDIAFVTSFSSTILASIFIVSKNFLSVYRGIILYHMSIQEFNQ